MNWTLVGQFLRPKGPTQPEWDELGPCLSMCASNDLKNQKKILEKPNENAQFDYLYIICYNIVGVCYSSFSYHAFNFHKGTLSGTNLYYE